MSLADAFLVISDSVILKKLLDGDFYEHKCFMNSLVRAACTLPLYEKTSVDSCVSFLINLLNCEHVHGIFNIFHISK